MTTHETKELRASVMFVDEFAGRQRYGLPDPAVTTAFRKLIEAARPRTVL